MPWRRRRGTPVVVRSRATCGRSMAASRRAPARPRSGRIWRRRSPSYSSRVRGASFGCCAIQRPDHSCRVTRPRSRLIQAPRDRSATAWASATPAAVFVSKVPSDVSLFVAWSRTRTCHRPDGSLRIVPPWWRRVRFSRGVGEDGLEKAFHLRLRGERAKGIEPSSPAWKAGALPLSYARASHDSLHAVDRRVPISGRDGRIRTGDPSLPKRVRYQAAPRPVGAHDSRWQHRPDGIIAWTPRHHDQAHGD